LLHAFCIKYALHERTHFYWRGCEKPENAPANRKFWLRLTGVEIGSMGWCTAVGVFFREIAPTVLSYNAEIGLCAFRLISTGRNKSAIMWELSLSWVNKNVLSAYVQISVRCPYKEGSKHLPNQLWNVYCTIVIIDIQQINLRQKSLSR